MKHIDDAIHTLKVDGYVSNSSVMKHDMAVNIAVDAMTRLIPIKPTIHSDSITCGECWEYLKTEWLCCPKCTKMIDWSEYLQKYRR